MSTITIATFNCENLFRRFTFTSTFSKEQVEKKLKDGFIIDKSVLTTVTQTERRLTTDAMKATKYTGHGLQMLQINKGLQIIALLPLQLQPD